jgi:FixJ family two-component response regulator
LPGARIILIAVADGILADSLRFSLELEGFDVKLCDERTLLSAIAAWMPGCLVLDQEVFGRIVDARGASFVAGLSLPVVLMVGQNTPRVLDRAKAAGIERVIEKPLLGGALFEAITHALEDLGSSCSGAGSCS